MPHFLDLISPQIHSIGSEVSRGWIGPSRITYNQALVLVENGTCETRFDGLPRIVNAPASFIIKPCNWPHSANQISRGKIVLRWLHFDWLHQDPPLVPSMPVTCYHPGKPRSELLRPAPDFIPADVIFHGPIPSPAITLQAFDRLSERWNNGTARERASCRALLLEMLIDLLGEQTGYLPSTDTARDEGGDTQRHLAARMRDMLNRMLDNAKTARLPLEEELTKLGFSYPHLCRVFTHTYGISPLTYYNSVRMERARLLLRDTLYPINEIAITTGFASPAYFTRLFTKYTGQSPRAYRNGKVENTRVSEARIKFV
ncbi:helix-turn-helix transcriptional regulator [Geminisphaera colitermitum]|uniref:helix-turn-helix transcriptional regulator n=1 Tax=Geminisphaera colitermitum TaxID=1148786 RepID=UPI0001964D4F|nr:AraC family transcriptional regulator [Geminisphaera colitermitum]